MKLRYFSLLKPSKNEFYLKKKFYFTDTNFIIQSQSWFELWNFLIKTISVFVGFFLDLNRIFLDNNNRLMILTQLELFNGKFFNFSLIIHRSGKASINNVYTY